MLGSNAMTLARITTDKRQIKEQRDPVALRKSFLRRLVQLPSG